MKKFLFSLLVFLPAFLFAQATIGVGGMVTDVNTGAPVANHPVYVYTDSSCSLYSNVVYTNMNGSFSDPNVPVQCIVYVYTTDCMNMNYLATIYPNFPPTLINFPINTCSGGGNCSAYFTASNSSPGVVDFMNSSTGSGAGQLTYSWDFGNGSTSTATNPTATYNNSGNYTVCLTVMEISPSGSVICSDTYCDSVSVNSGGGGCQAYFYSNASGNTVSFNNNSTPSGNNVLYSWDFGNGQSSTLMNPTYTYNAPGTYYVCLTMSVLGTGTISCTSTYCDTVTISGGGGGCQAYFYSNVSGNTATFSNQSQGGTFYNWNFGNGATSTQFNPTYTYPNPGTYNVCLTIYDSTGCQSTYCDTLTISGSGGGCQAYFNYQTSGSTVYFANGSTPNLPNGTLYSWDFGNGQSSTLMNPTYTYNAPGTYYVCLTMSVLGTGTITCTSIYCDTVTISGGGGGCQAYFYSNVSGNTATFSNQSQGGTFYNWNFGNGATSTQFNPTYTYPNPGTYNVCLTIYDSTGCQSTYCDTLTISGSGGGCQAFFNYQVSGNTAYFSNGSTPNLPNGTLYSWDFGNGQSSTLMNPTYTYNAPGTYYVCLTMSVLGTGTITCTSIYCDSVTISGGGGGCQAYFYSTVSGNVATFSNQSQGGTFYNWNFGNGATSTQFNPVYTYPNPGAYTVCLTIYDSTGCQSTYCDSIVISGSGGNCQAYFYGNASGNTVTFTNNSTPNNNTVTYSWDFGNGTSTAINPSYTYPSAGLYGVCLTMNVLGPNGNITCTSTYCDSVLIQGGGSGNCNASFVDTLVPGTTMIQFSSTSTGNIVSYLWTFPGGSPSTSTSPNPTVQFNSMQPVNVTLTITCLDSAGNTVTSTATKMITFTTDIEDAFIQSASDIYPNPSSTMAYMDIELKENSELSTKIVSVTGQVVAEKTGKYAAGKQQLQLNTESLSAGFYFVQITANGNTVITKKFVKE